MLTIEHCPRLRWSTTGWEVPKLARLRVKERVHQDKSP